MRYNKHWKNDVKEMQKRMISQAMQTAKHLMDYSAAKIIGVIPNVSHKVPDTVSGD